MPDDHQNTPPDAASNEPDYRFTLANERTFLAWQRTALGLLAASVATLQFLPQQTHPALRFGLGLTLGILAMVVAIGGLRRWRGNDDAIRSDRALPRSSMTVLLASGIGALGGGAVIAALMLAML